MVIEIHMHINLNAVLDNNQSAPFRHIWLILLPLYLFTSVFAHSLLLLGGKHGMMERKQSFVCLFVFRFRYECLSHNLIGSKPNSFFHKVVVYKSQIYQCLNLHWFMIPNNTMIVTRTNKNAKQTLTLSSEGKSKYMLKDQVKLRTPNT